MQIAPPSCEWPWCKAIATEFRGDARVYCDEHGPMVQHNREMAEAGYFAIAKKERRAAGDGIIDAQAVLHEPSISRITI